MVFWYSEKNLRKREKLFRKLVEELANLNSAQGAAVSDLAHLGRLGDFADLGSGDEIEFGGHGAGLVGEKAEDFVIIGDSSGSQVTDQSAVALGGFRGGEDSVGSIGVFGGTTATARSGDKGSAEDEALEKDNAAQEAERGYGGRAEGGGGTSSSGGSGSDDESSLSYRGQSQDGDRCNEKGVHAENENIWLILEKFRGG